ncbi:MAG: DUF1569 domain-containing protein [Bacteroidota bacterium]
MKTIFDQSTRDEVLHRIDLLSETAEAEWGKMSLCQMLKHCIEWEEMILRNKRYKRVFIGRIFGRKFLQKELQEGHPIRKNNPTIPELIIKETSGNILTAKKEWCALLREYATYSFPDNSFVHPFFGRMTKEQIGYFAYKHMDHHLKQFNA